MFKDNSNVVINYALIALLFTLAFFIIKPVIFSVIYGILLAFIFYPIYFWFLSKTKNKNLSAFIVSIGVLLIIVLIIVSLWGTLLNQFINVYVSFQKLDVSAILDKSLSNVILPQEVSSNIASSIENSISKLLAKFVTDIGDFVLNLPTITLQLFVVFFVFFFSLRDGEYAFEYFKSLSPLKKESHDKFFKQFKDITKSVLIGEFVVGILQGIAAGIGYFIFGVPNAILLTVLTIAVSILPIIGPWLVWIPLDIYLFTAGKTGAAVGLLIYGLLFINWIDTLVRPIIMSRITQINQAILLVGMIGGLLVFGVLGLIIGPLALAYVLLTLEMYRKQILNEEAILFKTKKVESPFEGS